MAEIVRMPKMSDTMTEGVVAKWHKKVGDTIKSGELMAEIETDKATMDYESFNSGTVLYLGVEEGKAVAVNDVLAIVGNPGEDYKSLLEGAGSAGSAPANKPAEEKKSEGKSTPQAAPETATATAVDTSNIKAEVVLMPKMSDTMNEGVIAAWHKKVGDTVKTNELLAEIETDKATMEYESYNAGTLLYIGAEAGKAVPVNGVLAVIGEKDADWKTLLKAHEGKGSGGGEQPAQPKPEKDDTKQSESKPAEVEASHSSNGRIKASPLAKKLAKDKGYDLTKISGSGENGRITKADVENYTPSTEAAPSKGGKAPVSLPKVVGEESF